MLEVAALVHDAAPVVFIIIASQCFTSAVVESYSDRLDRVEGRPS